MQAWLLEVSFTISDSTYLPASYLLTSSIISSVSHSDVLISTPCRSFRVASTFDHVTFGAGRPLNGTYSLMVTPARRCKTFLRSASSSASGATGGQKITDVAGLAEADLVDGEDSELVFGAVHQAGHQELGDLELLRDVTLAPVLSLDSLALDQIADDFTATVVCRFGPAEADGALGGVHHLGERRWAGRIWRIVVTHLLLSSHLLNKDHLTKSRLKQRLTDGVDSQCPVGGVTGFAQTGLVHGDDSELVLGALGQLNGLDGPIDDRSAVDLGPVPYWFSALTLNSYSCPSMSLSTKQSVMCPWMLAVTSAQLALLVSRFSIM
ncbi:hypothetical protein EYF80_020228 [Liparis tanakae]|uniref:Uncharacterized protein n=1 Tax=Liparis tanakae TaxID=230148 RepID=A0A4Z2HX56_9TELE|nr:hypothetical protein EYF80_020228 [Liparis tanakae]